jgi:signal transduction histidine kinase
MIMIGSTLGLAVMSDTARGRIGSTPGSMALSEIDTRVYDICIDSADRIWLATQHGVIVLHRSSSPFSVWTPPPLRVRTFNNTEVRSVTHLRSGMVAIGTAMGDVYFLHRRRDVSRGEVLTSRLMIQNRWRSRSMFRERWFDPVTSIVQLRSGDILLGTTGSGVQCMDSSMRPRSFISVYREHGIPDAKSSSHGNVGIHVYAMTESSKGKIYIGSSMTASLVVTTLDRSYQVVGQHVLASGTRGQQIIWAIHELDGRRLLIATTIGLYLLDTTTGRTTLVGSSDGLNVSSLLDMGSGIIYCGTYREGLMALDTRTMQLTTVRSMEAMALDDIYALVKDPSNNIWMSTSKGLVRYDRTSGRITRFGEHDGLPSLIFYPGAADSGWHTSLLFGTGKGVLICDPTLIMTRRTPAPLAITGLHVPGRLRFDIVRSGDTISFDQTESPITVQFASLDIDDNGRVLYRYRLRELDTAWSTATDDRSLTLLGLSPGHYTLEIQASDHHAQWSRPAYTTHFDVRPTFWHHPYTRWGMITLAVLAASGSLIQHRRRTQRMAVALSDARDAERRLIASALHDGPMQDLYGVRYMLDGRASLDAHEISAISSAVTSARVFIGATCRDLLQQDRPTDLIAACEQIIASFESSHRHIRVTKRLDDQTTSTWRSENERDAVIGILRTSLLNISQHAFATTVDITIFLSGGRIVLDITDDGIGIGPTSHARPRPDKGHGLTLCRAFAASCGGHFDIRQIEPTGTRVHFMTAWSARRAFVRSPLGRKRMADRLSRQA